MTGTSHSSGQSSKIVDFYQNKSIFLTGASGFVGKVLVEKLLRTCPNLDKIYILLRSKKNLTPLQRLDKEFIDCKLFINVDKKIILEKVRPLDGDLTAENFKLSPEQIKELCSNVNIVFHVAASVRFDDKLKVCLKDNVLGTKNVLDLCHQMNKLDCLVHVSTAYAYCQRNTSEEKLYPMKLSAKQVIDTSQWMDEDTLETCSSALMEGRPNTYTYTKAVAEHYLSENRGQLPIAIARPSIVTATQHEPFAGWVDSRNGPGGASLLGTLGVARSMNCRPNYTADLIPIDIVSNALIVIAWKTATDHKTKQLESNNNNSEEVDKSSSTFPIYNITSGDVNPTTWENFLEYGREVALSMPSIRMVRLPAKPPKGEKVNWYGHVATKIFSETLFAYLFDFICLIIGKKPLMVNLVRRMHSGFKLLEYFAMRQWSFPCDNLISLYDSLNETDKKLFNFDIRQVNWRTYTHNFYIGLRRHLMKEEDDNVPKALKHMQRLKIGYAVVKLISISLLIMALLWMFPVQNSSIINLSMIKNFRR